ncbi:chemotaxis protein CheB [Deltaproteobacteria bacterium TL4]
MPDVPGAQPSLYLYPGEILVSQNPVVINTLLGSCVAVCLWDEQRKIGGMNHVVYPRSLEPSKLTTQYANVATFVLYDELLRAGAHKKGLTARIFGGANQRLPDDSLKDGISAGPQNVEITLKVLRKLNIPLIGQDTGGQRGRKILFDLQTGKILLEYLQGHEIFLQQFNLLKGVITAQTENEPNSALNSANLQPSSPYHLIAIGASTGGPEAILEVLKRLPDTLPGIVISLHMPVGFTKDYAARLNQMSGMQVREAVHGTWIAPGTAWLAPGNRHLRVVHSEGKYKIELSDDPPVSHHRPSVDVMFQSIAQAARQHAIGIILTGMGNDGTKGLLAMKKAGAKTIGQNEATCVVYGMPREAGACGAVDRMLPLDQIPSALLSALNFAPATDSS